MKNLLGIALTAFLAACSEAAAPASESGPDTVYIVPGFEEVLDGIQVTPQFGENGGLPGELALEGTTQGPHGPWAVPGDTIVIHVRSPLYDTLAAPLVIPDTVSRNRDSVRIYRPVIRLTRVVPAVLGIRWSADFSGPTVQVDIYAPHGMEQLKLTGPYVYLQACRNGDAYCETRVVRSADRPDWRDSFATDVRAWVDISVGYAHLDGRWSGWPDALPPIGYGGPDSLRAWQATLNLGIEYEGHRGRGGCGGLFVPSAGIPSNPTCWQLYQS